MSQAGFLVLALVSEKPRLDFLPESIKEQPLLEEAGNETYCSFAVFSLSSIKKKKKVL